ncbi:S8 family serine peptidase [Bacillus sp. FSL W7-1360]
MYWRKKSFGIAATLLMVASLVTPSVSQATTKGNVHESLRDTVQLAEEKLNDRLLKQFKDDDTVTFLVKFRDKADAMEVASEAQASAQKQDLSPQKATFVQRSAVIAELKETATVSQQDVRAFVEAEKEKGTVKDFRSYHIVNGMAVTAPKTIAEKIATFSEVEKILPNEERQLHETVVEDVDVPESTIENVEWNIERVGAPDVWDMGIDGAGVVVASIDTGVQWDHPALKEKYRGYDTASGEVNHDFNFFDSTSAGREEAYDDQGHGTHVTGTMVGSEPNGANQVGVAPGAKWIAVKAFGPTGGATDQDLLNAAEWILAPTDSEGNARADLAPDIVNNSWGGGSGLDEWYRDVVINWRAAEIFPEFSAGNGSPSPGSISVPANYPESFATGATDVNDAIANFSLRGPSPYGELKPNISAPGVNIRSAVPGSRYEGGWNGTSMSGPAVSGVAALVKQANASLTVDDLEEVLTSTATPLTDNQYPEAPNHAYGHGLVNAYEAVTAVADGIGIVQGHVLEEGEDVEPPTYEHESPAETYAGMDLDLEISVADNIAITSVVLVYTDEEGNEQTESAERVSGNYQSGNYRATVPGEAVTGESFTYHWVVTDYGNNEVVSEDFTVAVSPGITIGYTQDFETNPTGWTSFGEQNSWAWGEPTSGPGAAASGDNVYATNLGGNYDNNMNATLVMPPIDLPEGNAYLQFKRWYDLENNYDYGHVFISTDRESWTQLARMNGTTSGWESAEVDLSDYSGQRVYIGFNLTSDFSIVRSGLYIDDVALVDTSRGPSTSLRGEDKNKRADVARHHLGITKATVDPDKIVPALDKEKDAPVDKGAHPFALPVGAQVSVVETGRSTNTNPANGSYSLSHAAGDYTLKAEAYGYEPAEQPVEIVDGETTEVNFMLQKMGQYAINGQVVDAETGDAIEGATVSVVEDANIAPRETGEDGTFNLTADEGVYTLSVVAPGYERQTVEVDLTENVDLTIELSPTETIPADEIGYDDGTPENARAFYESGNGWAVKMSLAEGKSSALVTDGLFRFWDTEWPVPGGTDFAVEVWDANGTNGLPGEKLAGPFEAEALRDGSWTTVDLSEHEIEVSGDFYMVYIQTAAHPNAPGLATDENGPLSERSYQYIDEEWSQTPEYEGNYMIRARVSYEDAGPLEAPVLTSPAEDVLTNDPALTVKGTTDPETTIKLENNGEAVDTVEADEEGLFEIPMTLSEGANELKAIAIVNGNAAATSDVITVTLDTEAPDLTIDSPQDGEKSNRETVVVEGTVSDANLDYVEVNGQRANVTDGNYSKRILVENGQNDITVVARDLAGNEATKHVTIDVQYDAPVIENLTPTEDKVLNAGETVKIEFDSEPGLSASFIIHLPLTNITSTNATALPMAETAPGKYVGYYTATSNVVADGAVIEVKAADSYGNESRQEATGKLFINVE